MNRLIALALCIAPIWLNSCSKNASTPFSPRPTGAAWPNSDDIYYFHLYSTYYDIHVPARDYGKSDNRKRKENQCLVTIAVSPCIKFYADLPNHYEPSIRIEGLISESDKAFIGSVRVDLEGVDVAYSHEQNTPMPLDTLVQLGSEPFHFAISKKKDPYSLDYNLD